MKRKIPFICFAITFFIMAICNPNFIEEIKDILGIRKLFEIQTLKYVCDKAGNSLTKKYLGGYDAKIYETKKLTKAQNAIINIARDSESNSFKDYFSRIAIFFVFLVLDVILIFCWISYCGCCCCCCCLFKTASPPSSKFRFIFFLISAIFKILVIIFSICVLGLLWPFLKRINGMGCSIFTLIDHFRDGLGNSYPKVENRWMGIPGLQQILTDSQNTYNKIINNSELNKTIEYAKSNYSSLTTDQCGIKKVIENATIFEKESEYLSSLSKSSFSSLDFSEEIQNIQEAYDKFTQTENDACQDVYDFLHDYINTVVNRAVKTVFTFTLVIAIIGLTLLILYYLCKSNVFRIIYVIIWNISMLLMILSILLSVVFGLIGYILHDAVAVIQYTLSENNLNSNDPIFIKSSSFVSDLINSCVNGNGEFLKIIQENEDIKKYTDDFNTKEQTYNNFKNRLSSLKCNGQEQVAKQSIINVYDILLEKTSAALNMSDSLVNVNCSFARNDEMIIMGEIDNCAKKADALCACSFLVGICFGISVLAGILFVHRYKYSDELKEKDLVKNDVTITQTHNESSQNINGNIKPQ